MTRFLITNDPGTAHPAKNVAVPELPHQPQHDMEGRTPMVGGTTPVNEPDRDPRMAWLMSRLRDQAEHVGRLSWAVDGLLFILDERASDLHLTEHERRNVARVREIADTARPGGDR